MDIVFGLVAVVAAFIVSATFGLGGSLILVPALTLMLGAKQGIALAALLLALNNIPKVVAYRRNIPWRKSAAVIVLSTVATAVGALALVELPDRVVQWLVFAVIGATFISELVGRRYLQRVGAASLAAMSGLTSGASGTSGPLKGLALRTLELPQAELVGAASVVSLAADATKTAVFTEAGLLTSSAWTTGAVLVPVMVACTLIGRTINTEIQARTFTVGFWAVMAGYGARLVFLW
jgi:uncharacterized protein